MIAIFTLSKDLHALEIQAAVKQSGYKDIAIVETDRIANAFPISIEFNKNFEAFAALKMTANNGMSFNIADCDAIWLRRPKANQLGNQSEPDYINNECKAGIGSTLTCAGFKGRWISHPEATIKASDKIYQLQTAMEVGFQIPETIVSQSREEVVRFYEQCNKKIIAKPLLGVAEPFLVTQQLKNPLALPKKAYSVCPTIYQELIEGTRHIRLNSFGSYKVAALIESNDLDWRPNLHVPISHWPIPEHLSRQVDAVLDKLGLAMGVFDFKLTDDEKIVWLEVNPQGQFLFLEPFLKSNLAGHFAQFLIKNANARTAQKALA